jgi:light-regulated signal transduction histidine kinase (bacteriophytochrome)
MKIQLWHTREMSQWRWTLTDNSRPVIKMESGSQHNLRDALNDVANTVEYLLRTGQLDEDV